MLALREDGNALGPVGVLPAAEVLDRLDVELGQRFSRLGPNSGQGLHRSLGNLAQSLGLPVLVENAVDVLTVAVSALSGFLQGRKGNNRLGSAVKLPLGQVANAVDVRSFSLGHFELEPSNGKKERSPC